VEEGRRAPAETVAARPSPDPDASVEDAIATGAQRADEVAVVADPVAVVVDLDSMIDLWPAVVELVGAEHALCGAVITDARPVEIAGENLIVGFPTTAAFLKRQAEDPANRAIVTEALRRLTGGGWRVSYELREELGDSGASGSGGEAFTEEEWVARLKAELDAEEIPVEPESVPAKSAQKGE
jgi:hypothetical protein